MMSLTMIAQGYPEKTAAPCALKPTSLAELCQKTYEEIDSVQMGC